jgi:hypothetical protein
MIVDNSISLGERRNGSLESGLVEVYRNSITVVYRADDVLDLTSASCQKCLELVKIVRSDVVCLKPNK